MIIYSIINDIYHICKINYKSYNIKSKYITHYILSKLIMVQYNMVIFGNF